MTFCTIVEFEWDETFDHERFATTTGNAGADMTPPDGCLSRIVGIDAKGARMIEVWRSSDDARAFAEKTGPALASAQLPPPSRVLGFDVTAYVVA
jgi:hypothetical protein